MSHLCKATYVVADYFKARPGLWVSAITLAEIGGRLSSRTRISECRRVLGMHIENRIRRVKLADGLTCTASEFRFTPPPVAARADPGLPLFAGISG